MKVRTLLLLCLFSMGLFLPNCSDGLDCSFGPVPDFFDIQGMLTNHVGRDNNLIEVNEISFADYEYLALNFDVEYIAYEHRSAWNFDFVNQVYGCSPPEAGLEGSKFEAFDNITITTLNDFDDDHLADTSINDLLRVMYSNYRELLSLEEFLAREGNVKRPGLFFQLTKAPELNQELRLRVTVELSTGERYEAVTHPLLFI